MNFFIFEFITNFENTTGIASGSLIGPTFNNCHRQSSHKLCPVLHWHLRHRSELQLWRTDAAGPKLVRQMRISELLNSPDPCLTQRKLHQDSRWILPDHVAGELSSHTGQFPAGHPRLGYWSCLRHGGRGCHCLCPRLCHHP